MTISRKQQIFDFVEYYGQKPFTINYVSELLGINYGTVQPRILELVKTGKLKKVNKRRFQYFMKPSFFGNGEFEKAKIDALIGVIETNECTGYKKIAKLSKISHPVALDYLQAMASAKIIGFHKFYIVLDKEKISDIGKVYEQNILQRLQSNYHHPFKNLWKNPTHGSPSPKGSNPIL